MLYFHCEHGFKIFSDEVEASKATGCFSYVARVTQLVPQPQLCPFCRRFEFILKKARKKSWSSPNGIGKCRKERYKGNGNFFEGCKVGGLE